MSIYTLIPVLPLAAALILALSGRKLQGAGHRLVIPAVAVSFLLSIAAFIDVSTNGAIEVPLYRLIDAGRLVVDLGLFIDPLTVLLLFLVTGVSTVVQIYSSRYMIGDARHSRFFAVTALFTSAMTMLVMSSNLLLTFIFWEVMGLCSYLLISHYAERRSAYRAATKVFLVNSVADVGLGLGVILTFRAFGTLDIPEILARVQAGADIPTHAATLLVLCLFVGAIGKSAQMPLHVWLPFAMEAPTPVSALIHAATMVNAGPFLLVRLSPLVALSEPAMAVIAVVGAATALFAAAVSLTQTDVKRILAYSTMSQLGFMTLLCGVGAFVAAIFHLLAHGFFKAFLFLSTGNVLAATHRDIEMPEETPDDEPTSPASALFAGALIMSVVPPLVIFSGPYQHLWLSQSFGSARIALWVVGLGTVFFTAMYLFQGVTTVFRHGPPGARDGAATVQPILFSLRHVIGVALAAAAAIAVLMSAWSWLAAFLSPAVGRSSAAATAATTGFSPWIAVPLAVAAAGWAFAYVRRGRPRTDETTAWMKRLYVFFLNKGYFDEIYDRFIVRPTIAVAVWLYRNVDEGVIDRLVVSLGALTSRVSHWLWQSIDVGIIDRVLVGLAGLTARVSRWLWESVDERGIAGSVEGLGRGVSGAGRALQGLEPRTLQHNLLVVVFWLIAALGFFYWIV